MKKTIFALVLVLLVGIVGFVLVSAWAAEINFNFNKGWNLIYGFISPDQLDGQVLEKQNIKAIYAFVPTTQKYVRLFPNPEMTLEDLEDKGIIDDNEMLQNAFWVYTEKGAISEYWLYDVPKPINEKPIYKGWNFIGITSDMIGKSLWENRGTCDIEKAYGWENEGDRQGWENINQYERINSPEAVGIAVVVKVSSNCNLGTSSLTGDGTSPPGLPGTDNGFQDTSYKCTETDSGLDYYTAGAVYYGEYDYIDSCGHAGVVNVGTPQEYTIVEGDLLEHACYGPDNDKRCTESACRFVKYHCPNGCKDGACIQ